jgi:hypothetical protein
MISMHLRQVQQYAFAAGAAVAASHLAGIGYHITVCCKDYCKECFTARYLQDQGLSGLSCLMLWGAWPKWLFTHCYYIKRWYHQYAFAAGTAAAAAAPSMHWMSSIAVP